MTLAVDLRLIDIKPTAVTVPIPRHLVYTVEFFALGFGRTRHDRFTLDRR